MVLTALFARADMLRSPHHRVDTETVGCYFAFVDQQSAHMLLGQRPRTKASFEPDGATGVDGASMEALVTVGVWRLIVLAAEGLPYREARRNSRVPKLLVHRFFPEAAFAIWVDAKLELRMAPTDAVRRFLLAPRAGGDSSVSALPPPPPLSLNSLLLLVVQLLPPARPQLLPCFARELVPGALTCLFLPSC